MLCEADIKVSWRARPRGFVALMGLYESNYLRFLHLAGNPTRLAGTLVSRVDGDCELHLAVLEHMPYTSTLSLTYLHHVECQQAPHRAAAGSAAARLSRCAAAGGRTVPSAADRNTRGAGHAPGGT